MDAAHGLYAQESEHEEHDRQDARETTPRIGELRTSGTCQVHGEPQNNGMDTVLGNTALQCGPPKILAHATSGIDGAGQARGLVV